MAISDFMRSGWRRLFGSPSKPEGGGIGAAVEYTTAGEPVSPASALGLPAYLAAVRNIAEDVAKLPLRVFRRTGAGEFERVRVTEGPEVQLLSEPGAGMTGQQIRQTLTAWALGWGNGYAWIQRNGAGLPIELRPIHPDRVVVHPSGGVDPLGLGRDFPLYEVQLDMDREPFRIQPRDMLHIANLGDGVCGWSVAMLMAEALGLGVAQQSFAGSYYGQGMHPGGVVTAGPAMSANAKQALLEALSKSHQGPRKGFRPLLLDSGATYSPFDIKATDAQFLQSRQFQLEEIARAFRIPPHKIGHLERATFSNIEHQGQEYLSDTLEPWLVRWESEIRRKLMPAGYEVDHDSRMLLRGDNAARAAIYASGITNGWMRPNEARVLEGLPPSDQPGADELHIQGATVPLGSNDPEAPTDG